MTLIEALCLAFYILGGMCYVVMFTLISVLRGKGKPDALVCTIGFILWPLLSIKDVISMIFKGSNNPEG